MYSGTYRCGKKDTKFTSRPRKRKAWNKGLKIKNNEFEAITSTSERKLKDVSYPECSFTGYRIFNFEKLSHIINSVTCCKLCGADVTFIEDSLSGLGGEYKIICQGCEFVQNFSSCFKNRKKYDLNDRLILASRMIGSGLADMKTFCGVMDLPPPVFSNSFTRLQKTVLQAATDEADHSMQKAVKEEKYLVSKAVECGQVSEENLEQIKVKGDGSWQKRGFSSLNGSVTLIGADTEKVIDHEVLTSHCKSCSQWQKENGPSVGEKWEDWYSLHKLVCTRNYFGTSGGMESNGMVKIFKRSEEKYGIKYTQYIGDGDSKTFHNISKAKPYGPDIEIKKLECIGHVGKRFGYHMRKLKTDMRGKKLSDGKGLFGRGRLTDKIITSMQTYYTGAIRNNSSSLSGMIRSIWAILYHLKSNDANPQHQFCPAGPNSWCKFKKAEALHQLQDFKHRDPLPPAVVEAIHPVFIKMTSISLLKRCLGGHTQNSNESFNSILWKFCPKSIFLGRDSLTLGAKLAVVIFNDGMSGLLQILERLDISPGVNAVAAARQKDNQRLAKAKKEKEEDYNRTRMIYRQLNINLHDQFLQEEGEEEYQAGAY